MNSEKQEQQSTLDDSVLVDTSPETDEGIIKEVKTQVLCNGYVRFEREKKLWGMCFYLIQVCYLFVECPQ